jgi:hypothetical protein
MPNSKQPAAPASSGPKMPQHTTFSPDIDPAARLAFHMEQTNLAVLPAVSEQTGSQQLSVEHGLAGVASDTLVVRERAVGRMLKRTDGAPTTDLAAKAEEEQFAASPLRRIQTLGGGNGSLTPRQGPVSFHHDARPADPATPRPMSASVDEAVAVVIKQEEALIEILTRVLQNLDIPADKITTLAGKLIKFSRIPITGAAAAEAGYIEIRDLPQVRAQSHSQIKLIKAALAEVYNQISSL